MPRRGENIYKRKDGRWEARYIYAYSTNGKPRYRSIYAPDYLGVKKKQKQAIQQINPADLKQQMEHPKRTISYYSLLWLNQISRSSKESTFVRYRFIYEHYIQPSLEHIRICDFNNKIYEAFINQLLDSGRKDGTGLSSKMVLDIRSVLKGILEFAEKSGELIPCNLNLYPIKLKTKPFYVLSKKEHQVLQEALLQDLNGRNLGILTSLYTGLRLGELCALQWSDINFEDQIIEVTKTMQRIKDYSETAAHKTKIVITSPKTSGSMRKVPIPVFLLELLQDVKVSSESDAYLLTGLSDKFYEPRSMEYYFKKILRQCNLNSVHFHCLRHTFATRCVELGFDVKTLSEILGHSNINTTLNRYVHPSMELKQQNMEKLNEIFTGYGS